MKYQLLAPVEAFELTTTYIRICGAGIIVIMAYNMIGGIFRGMGDSNTPLVTVLIACICNIIGDLLFVAVLHMGTKGAALATPCSTIVQILLCFGCLIYMSRKKDLKLI